MFLAHPGDVIQALDATSGDLDLGVPVGRSVGKRWTRPEGGRARAHAPAAFATSRSSAIACSTSPAIGHLIALNARTGTLAWSVAEAGAGIGHMAGPMIADGKIVERPLVRRHRWTGDVLHRRPLARRRP